MMETYDKETKHHAIMVDPGYRNKKACEIAGENFMRRFDGAEDYMCPSKVST